MSEVVVDGYCPFLTCLLTEPHAHPVCPDCGAVRYGNMACQTCAGVRSGDLNPHRMLDASEIEGHRDA